MARQHFWYYITNEEGQPVEGAEISLYAAGTTTPMYVYLQETGGSATNTLPQVTSDSEGFFEFWIADSSEVNGYVSGSKFTMVWSKPGEIDDGVVEYIDFTTPRVLSISTQSISTTGWSSSGANYYCDISHELSNEYPIVQVYSDSTKQTVTVTVETISPNTVRIWGASAINCHVTIMG